MSDPVEIRKTLKRWEITFYKKHNRKPSKSDIDTAPQEIRDAYKNYANLKKEKCVSTKNTSECNENVGAKNGKPIESGEVILHEDQEDCRRTKSDQKENSGNFVNPTKSQDNDEVWGSSLNKTIPEESKEKDTKKKPSYSFLDKLGNKLFQNSKKIPSSSKKPDPSWHWKSGGEETPDSVRKSSKGNGSFEEAPGTPFSNMENSNSQSEEPMDETDGCHVVPFSDKQNNVFSPKPKFSKFSTTPKFSVAKQITTPSSDVVDVPGHLKLGTRKKFSVSNFTPKDIKNPFPEDESDSFSYENNTEVKKSITTAARNVVEVDESMFEQEFAENFEPPSFTQSKPKTPKSVGIVRKSGARNTNLLDDYGTNEADEDSSKKEKDKSIQKVVQDTSDVFDPSDMSDDEEGEISKKKTTSRKRKQTTNTTSRKRVKANDGIACPVGGDGMADGVDNGEEEVVKKPKAKPPPRRPTASKSSSDNFIRLNMKVKKYRRKDGRHLTGPQYKRKQWKQKMQARSKSYGDKCFICNETGHWSRDCPKKHGGSKKAVEEIDENDFPSIQEAAGIARGIKIDGDRKTAAPSQQTGVADVVRTEDSVDPMLDVEKSIVRSRREQIAPPPPVQPLLCLQPDGELADTASVPDIKMGLKMYGFKQFRQGQEETVKRILTGLSTLVVLSTGGGKSLCYQLPAYIYAQHSRCITIVVSPLVSLMEDQVTGLPPGVRGACLHANMTKAQRDGVLAAVNDGSVHFLLVSPEAVVGGGGGLQGSFPAPDKLPPIAFVCIDEAHCLSEWSHNFRPSYLRLCKVLRERYGVKCFLGLTATATKATALDVAKHLGIQDVKKATIRGSPIPRNLILSVSQDENRDEALVQLLSGERFRSCHSIIIYCTRRELTNRVATLLRTCLKEEVDLTQPAEEPTAKGRKKKKKKKVAVAENYHAGLTPGQRKRVQRNFMSGSLRIVVATVAFGMGLDKSDVRAVIHYNMPKSFEGYVQEIGRAGRDGKPSHCHLFLDPEGKDLSELKRHTYGNTVDRFALKKLMSRVFKKCRCREIHESRQEDGNREDEDAHEDNTCSSQRVCPGHERAMPIDKTILDLDIREEGIATLLCYLELHPECCLENLQPVYASCKIICYGGPPQLHAVAKKSPPIAVAIAKQKMKGKSFSQANSLEFPIVEISDTMGWDSGPVKREVKLLQWNMAAQGQFTSKSGVLVEFSDLAFHLRSPGDLTEEELDDMVDFLHRRVTRQEKTELFQLNLLYNSLKSAAHKSYWMCADEADVKKSDRLRQLMENFFHEERSAQERMEEEEEGGVDISQIPSSRDLEQLMVDIRSFANMYGEEHNLNGRAIARIFHGIGSPCFPIDAWCRVRRFWRSHLHVNFNVVLKSATRELVRIR